MSSATCIKKPNEKPGNKAALFALSCALIFFAAFLMCSLLFAVISPVDSANANFAAIGRFLSSVYGITSFLIPAFFLACAISLIVQKTSFSIYFMLLVSVIPFFTAFAGEKLIRTIISNSGVSFLSKIIFFGLSISTVLAVITEYIVFFQLSGYVEKKLFPRNDSQKTEEPHIKKEAFHVRPEPQPVKEEEYYRIRPMPVQEIKATEGEFVSSYNLHYPARIESAKANSTSAETLYRLGAYSKTSIADNTPTRVLDTVIEVPTKNEVEEEVDLDFLDAFTSSVNEINKEINEGVQEEKIEEKSLKEDEVLIPDVDFNPEMFEGYIAGNFSVINEAEELASPADLGKSEKAAGRKPFGSLFKKESVSAAAFATNASAKPRKRSYSIDSSVLDTYPDGNYWVIDDDTNKAAAVLKETLSEFNIQADVTGIRKGPVITMFEILPAPGVKLSRIVGLQDNIALRLAASSIRIVAPIPGKHAVGIEVPNTRRAIVSFRELIETKSPALAKMSIPVVLGKDIAGEAQIIDLAATPHLLIAGSTGSGKSVCVNSIILSILYKKAPDQVKLILIDPKVVELKLYNDIAHLLSPVITEPKKAFQALQYCLCEMERRYAILDSMGVRNIKEYNRRIEERAMLAEKLPYIVVIIDEFADLMATSGKELESTVARLAAMSRAVGIHLVLATQRPSIDVITGLIKANIPSRIAFMVASKIDSRIIIDQVGAEKLLGKGDMLYASVTDPFPVRIQGAFVSDEEVERVVKQVKAFGEPEYIDDEIFVEEDDEVLDTSFFDSGEDPLYDKALDIVLSAGKASASYIQRRLKIGYNRAARLVEEMEERGIVGPANGSKPRDLIHIPDRQH